MGFSTSALSRVRYLSPARMEKLRPRNESSTVSPSYQSTMGFSPFTGQPGNGLPCTMSAASTLISLSTDELVEPRSLKRLTNRISHSLDMAFGSLSVCNIAISMQKRYIYDMKARTFLTAAALALCCTFAASAQTDSTFFIDGSMGRLSTRLQLPELQEGEKCPVVVICHGFMGNKNEPLLSAIADNLVELGIGAIRCDFNGHGRSEGEFVDMTVLNEIDDALAVIDYVRRMPQTDGISVLGHSQGGVVAAMTAGQLGSAVLKSAVLMAPAAVLRDDALRGSTMGATYDPWHAPEYVDIFGNRLGRDYIQTALSLPIYETAAKYDGPVLVLHGMADKVVPYTYGERFGREMPDCTVQLLPGDDHGFTADMTGAAEMAADWLASTLLK